MSRVGIYRALSRLALPALAILSATPAFAADATGQAQVAVISPLSLINTEGLSFGNFTAGATPGTVVINQNSGARTVTGGVTALGGAVSPARFLGAAAGLNLVFIRQPTVVRQPTRVSGTEIMPITAMTIQGGQFRLFVTRQSFTFNIGATLNVGANQAEGLYEGEIRVVVDYY